MRTIAETLVEQLVERDVDTIFGIPGVHTIELYRGLVQSGIRHVTPRHEQGAGFMADGYARISGKPGVAFVITGPGLTNTLTAMGQARADSVPTLVISGVNSLSSLGKGLGHLHELPDQLATMRTIALVSERIEKPEDLTPVLDRVFASFQSGRPGPCHIEVPLDVARSEMTSTPSISASKSLLETDQDRINEAVELLNTAEAPIVLAGGGSRRSGHQIRLIAESLDAPVVQTVNARGIMHSHPLGVPASPSLNAVRHLIESSDVILAAGTELGPTDYDMYESGSMAFFKNLIRIDICPDQLARHGAKIPIVGDSSTALTAIYDQLTPGKGTASGATRAASTRRKAFEEIGPQMQACCDALNIIRDTIPNAIFIGDSTQPVYAGNLYYDHDRPGGWFNAATGYGALGYGIPAAIGASIADPLARVVCFTGDGGAQFSMAELMCAVDEKLPILFVIWNNQGYQEISAVMQDAGVPALGCDPTPPDFSDVAKSCRIPFWRCNYSSEKIASTLKESAKVAGPAIVEITVSPVSC